MMTAEASALIAAANAANIGPIPAYGSTEWCALPAADPRRAAAFAVAAEAWREYCSTERVEQDLHRQIEQLRHVYLADLVGAYQAGLDGHRAASRDVSGANWRYLAAQAGRDEEARARRAQICDASPRPGDLPGRGAA